jgi:KUP system potassium uptake protein
MENSPQQPLSRKKAAILTLTALGVVFGDIGTSPLYALRECFAGHGHLPMTQANVLGSVSVIIWTLVLVVCVKYVMFVMRADNRGEGGILALISQVLGSKGETSTWRYKFFILIGILGVALLYSDGIITPAITVLTAVEGLTEATPDFKPYIMVLSLGILIGLFMLQSRGTAKVGTLFGPIILGWFGTIAFLGACSIVKNPLILLAVNPYYAIRLLATNGPGDFAFLGSIFLCVTGAEMLFADIGHFGRIPIRRAWFVVVFPSVVINYLGQGAYLLSIPPSAENLFYRIVPQWFLYPMVLISTSAAVIASQAVISGAYSLTRQSIQLGFWPRMRVLHTSSSTIGQVYLPFVNWSLMVGVILLVLIFRRSSDLAAAYGIAVSIDMFITTMLIAVIARQRWRAKLWQIAALFTVFFFIDGSFLVSNFMKVQYGGWIVLAIAAGLGICMKTWRDGREIVLKNMVAAAMDLESFVRSIQAGAIQRVPGIAVFLSGNSTIVPKALLHNLKHNKVMHEHTLILTIRTKEIPLVKQEKRVFIEYVGAGIYRMVASYGFSETPDIPALLESMKFPDLKFDPMQTTYFLGRELLVPASRNRRMAHWRKRLFMFMSHISLNATSFFKIPANRVVELGSQIEL